MCMFVFLYVDCIAFFLLQPTVKLSFSDPKKAQMTFEPRDASERYKNSQKGNLKVYSSHSWVSSRNIFCRDIPREINKYCIYSFEVHCSEIRVLQKKLPPT